MLLANCRVFALMVVLASLPISSLGLFNSLRLRSPIKLVSNGKIFHS
jgi:hypothetical protein